MIPPEPIALELNPEGSENGLYFPQFFKAMFSSAPSRGSIIGAGRIFQCHTMEKKNSLLGEVSDVATSLLNENLKSKLCKKCDDNQKP